MAAALLCILLAACGGGSPAPQAAVTDAGSGAAPAGQPQATSPSDSPPAAGESSAISASGDAAAQDDVPEGADARFNRPIGLARDNIGNLFVADAGNHTIRKITPAGVVTTVAGAAGVSGSNDGVGPAARFSALKGLAVDGTGNIYAVDNSAIRKVTPTGVVSTLAGIPGELGDSDGPGSSARFRRPWGIAVDAASNVYVADTENRLVRRITPAGNVVTHAGTRGMRGTADGSTASATFLGPAGIATDSSGNLYLTDWYGPPAPNIPERSTFIRRIGTDGTVSTMAGSYNTFSAPAPFLDTFAIAADREGNVYVAARNSVQRISTTGTITTVAGPVAQFQSLEGIAIDDAGNLYVTDTPSHTIHKVSPGGEVTTVAGKALEPGSRNAP